MDLQRTSQWAKATATAPLLQLLDLLPGLQPGSVPYKLAFYTGGAECEGEHGSMPREAEVIGHLFWL
jgi:hypothetical protein